MNEQQRNKQLIEEHYSAFWSGDASLIRQQISDEYVDHGMPGSPVGVEPVLAHSSLFRASFPDMKVTVNASVAEGDRVAVHATWQGTHKATFQGVPATNKVITFEGMVFWRIVNGKLTERWAILDTAAIARQLRP
jgi:steroid delta-isomerase-like uncharacterized protein